MSEASHSSASARDVDPRLIRALIERGYSVVPSFFSPDELAVVREDFESVRRRNSTKGVELPSELLFDDERMRPIRDRLTPLIDAVAHLGSGQRALLPVTIGNYICSSEVKYGLHCDFGCLSPSRDAFKIWIPLKKSDPARDGMTFVRMDKFREREPEMARRIAGRGATAIKNGCELVIVGPSIEKRQLKEAIDDICETPEARVGDVVLFRAQDTFHRSQEESVTAADTRGERVAWAFPVRMAAEVVHRREVFRDRAKRPYLGRWSTAMVVACSWSHRREEITYEELGDFERQVHAGRGIPIAMLVGAYAVEPFFWGS